MKKSKKEPLEREWFIVMNSQLEYFAGLLYGGQIVWSKDYDDAKPLDLESKFIALKNMSYVEELILDYIK
jgi:hypothetical protein